MEKLIACCGLDCAVCEGRIATVTNDMKMKEKIAEQWKKDYNSPDITPDKINCTGCREEGAKISHCDVCGIRKCVKDKSFDTCADCDELGSCETGAFIHKNVLHTIENLKSLKN